MIRATPSWPRSATMSAAPNSRASFWRSAWRLMAMIRPPPIGRAAMTPISPTAPSPITTTVPPSRTCAASAAYQPVPRTSVTRLRSPTCFDPRPCGRGDPAYLPPWPVKAPFRPTPLREGRRHGSAVSALQSSFDPRPCGRGDRLLVPRVPFACCFDPRPCGRGDQTTNGARTEQQVSIHAPAGGATALLDSLLHFGRFRSTPLREGRHRLNADLSVDDGFRSTPLREGRQAGMPNKEPDAGVSIHAPAGGATLYAAETRGPSMFRSTPLREGRHRHVALRQVVSGVSIHAPAGGATRSPELPSNRSSSFDPRPCGRGDSMARRSWHDRVSFRSTPLREGRPRAIGTSRGRRRFDPRPCGRGDDIPWFDFGRGHQFRSTPLREGRPGVMLRSAAYRVFRSTPLREGRPTGVRTTPARSEFRSTPLREGRQEYTAITSAPKRFRSTPLREGRRRVIGAIDHCGVSIHAPAGGATRSWPR